MIKYALILFFGFYIHTGICGVTVVGTRFVIDEHAKHLNIKVSNDDENDYLIKSELDDKDFIISPPLLLLPKNSSKLVTIIPKETTTNIEDKLLNLTITMIPKSTLNDDTSSVSLAVRNHFRVIHRHTEINISDYSKIGIFSDNDKCLLFNDSNFVFTLSWSKEEKEPYSKIINLPPYETIILENTSPSTSCESWVSFYDDYNDIIKKIKLAS